jgi:NADPH:quinone reductase
MEIRNSPRDHCHARTYPQCFRSAASHDARAPHDVRRTIDRFGEPDVITCHALSVPALDAGEVLIAVDTAGVGPWDADVREGLYAPRKPHFPLVLGFDGAGIVAPVGSRVRRLKVGDEVYSYNWQNPKGGFYAEYVAVPADKVAPIPRRLDLRHAGATPTTGLTALQGIDDAGLKKGETVIIHGASGGVGTLAVHAAVDGKRVDIDDQARRFAPGFAAAGGRSPASCHSGL